MLYKTAYQSPLGLLTLASDGENLIGLWIEGQKYHGGSLPEIVTMRDDIQVFKKTKSWLDRYFAGKKPEISELPLLPMGSDFRLCIWRIICEIPYGEVMTYGGIGKRVMAKMNRESMSFRAIGGAVGHNPISIIIPCHRVVGANGSLTGYAGGVDKKISLLELEGVDMGILHIPSKGTAL